MILYTKSVCPKCMLVKSVLNASELEGKYEIINIEENESAKNKIVEAGFMSVPILEIDGKLIGEITEIQKAISELT